MITCASCGTKNPDGNAICMACGAPLNPSGKIADNQSYAPPPPPDETEQSLDQHQTIAEQPPQPVASQTYLPPTQTAQTFQLGLKNKTYAWLLEIIPGLFGVYGIGNLYAGNTTTGLALLIGGLVWDVLLVIIIIFTIGIGFLCGVVNLILLGVGIYLLYAYMNKNPRQFIG